ncbi:MAG: class I SAM-dependent methyltransferase [Fibrobacter sp.]|nr:class I SAM-dependent methyltransferase [Fibrobacter sp.]
MLCSLILKINDLVVEPFIRKMKEQICTLLPENNGGLLLDLCSSSGEQSNIAFCQGYKVIGLDLNYYSLRYARKKYPQINFICADASKIPFKEGTFSYIVITNGIHDKHELLRNSIIEQAYMMLKQNGYLAITDLEKPWNKRSFIQNIFTSIIEIFSGHCKNGFSFLKLGGVTIFIKKINVEIVKTKRYSNRNIISLICQKI